MAIICEFIFISPIINWILNLAKLSQIHFEIRKIIFFCNFGFQSFLENKIYKIVNIWVQYVSQF